MAETETEQLLQSRLTIESNGETYEFRIPSFEDEIRLGMHARAIRRRLDPDHDGSAAGVDLTTAILVRTAAVFEVLLETATTRWPYSTGEKGQPVVDWSKWPKDKFEEASMVGMLFEEELGKFRAGGPADPRAGGEKALDGQPNP